MNGKILVELQSFMGSDREIAMSAWTSTYDKEKMEDRYNDPEKIAALVPRLVREGHSTPLESVILRFWIRMPIFTDRQHMTHRIASHNGLSGRYRTLPDDWFPLPPDVIGILNSASENGNWGSHMKDDFDQVCARANAFYKTNLELLKNAEMKGVISNSQYKRVREVLRGALPTAGMVERTTIFNLRSFANYQRLRNSSHAQPEIKYVAEQMLEEVLAAGIAPVAINTLIENGWRI